LVVPPKVIGKTTIDAIRSGRVYGYVAMVEGMIDRISEELDKDPFVVATGGLATLISSLTDSIDRVEPNLTLDGLRIIWNPLASMISSKLPFESYFSSVGS
jgi:type III pantothenate kinase